MTFLFIFAASVYFYLCELEEEILLLYTNLIAVCCNSAYFPQFFIIKAKNGEWTKSKSCDKKQLSADKSNTDSYQLNEL